MSPVTGDRSFVGVGLRQRVREAAVPLARALGRLGLTPDALTLIGFAVSVVAALAAAAGLWVAAGLLVVFGGLFDLLDGALARVQGKASPYGAFLDATFDRWGETVVFIGIAAGLLGPGAAGVVFPALGEWPAAALVAVLAGAAMGAAFMVSYSRAKAESVGFEAAVGVAPRAERIAVLAAGLVLQPATGWSLGAALLMIFALATVTVIQRVAHVRAQARAGR